MSWSWRLQDRLFCWRFDNGLCHIAFLINGVPFFRNVKAIRFRSVKVDYMIVFDSLFESFVESSRRYWKFPFCSKRIIRAGLCLIWHSWLEFCSLWNFVLASRDSKFSFGREAYFGIVFKTGIRTSWLSRIVKFLLRDKIDHF